MSSSVTPSFQQVKSGADRKRTPLPRSAGATRRGSAGASTSTTGASTAQARKDAASPVIWGKNTADDKSADPSAKEVEASEEVAASIPPIEESLEEHANANGEQDDEHGEESSDQDDEHGEEGSEGLRDFESDDDDLGVKDGDQADNSLDETGENGADGDRISLAEATLVLEETKMSTETMSTEKPQATLPRTHSRERSVSLQRSVSLPAWQEKTAQGRQGVLRKELRPGRLCQHWDSIKRGCILYTWQNGLEQAKVPYWIVPDEMINDPLLVEHVIQAMGLMPPNLLLRFSRVKSSIMSWHNYWDFDKTGDGDVTEAELPFVLPPGMSREKREVAEYLCSIAKDRVRNILSGVCSACNQAGACAKPLQHQRHIYHSIPPLLREACATLAQVPGLS